MMLSAINRMKKITWIIPSIRSPIIFFQNNFCIEVLRTMKAKRPPSRAGIGRRLNTPRLIEIMAPIIRRKIIPSLKVFEIKSTSQIGPLICSIASLLSSFVFGANIFCTRIQSHLNVKIVCP